MLSLADVITMVNAVFGFLAIVLTVSDQFTLVASLILLGLLADGLDGIIARRVGNGRMGQFLETIADATSLVVAPLFLVYKTHYDVVIVQTSLQLAFGVVLMVSFICSVLRLSSFPTLKEQRFFVGLPTSANAIFLIIVSFLTVDLWYILPFMVVFAYLMVSPIRYPKNNLNSDLVAAGFIIGAILLYFLRTDIAPLLLLIGLILYVIIGPISVQMKKKD